MSESVSLTSQPWFKSIQVEEKKIIVHVSDIEAARAILPESWMGFMIEIRAG